VVWPAVVATGAICIRFPPGRNNFKKIKFAFACCKANVNLKSFKSLVLCVTCITTCYLVFYFYPLKIDVILKIPIEF
jgi:hypothetical protein